MIINDPAYKKIFQGYIQDLGKIVKRFTKDVFGFY